MRTSGSGVQSCEAGECGPRGLSRWHSGAPRAWGHSAVCEGRGSERAGPELDTQQCWWPVLGEMMSIRDSLLSD